jgi:acetolactate synthase-1/2/3 large subunit
MSSTAIVADYIVSRLREAGVRALFGVPGGGGNLDLVAAAGRASLPFVLTATETAAAIAASAQAEITGAPGACLTTLGPGAASVVNGVAAAFLDRVPLIVFTDSMNVADRTRFEHQRLDHRGLFAPITRSAQTLNLSDIESQLTEGLAAATGGPPGPVHFDCPGDLARQPIAMPTAWVSYSVRGYGIGGLSLSVRPRRPLVIAGLGARADDAAAIRRLCEHRAIPAMVTYKAKGVVPDDHPWFAGVFTNGAIEQPLVDESDLILAFGLDPVELLPRPWPYTAPVMSFGHWSNGPGHVPFHIDEDAGIQEAVRALESAVPESIWSNAAIAQHRERQRAAVRIPAVGFTADTVVEIAAARLASLARVTVDAGAHMFPATTLWPVSEPNGLLISNGLSTMGFALPAAIGAALLDRDRPVVALTGDGGLLMCAGELLTAARERLRIIVIVFNDASLSLIEIKQQARRLDPAGVALGAVDWAMLASSMGVAGFTAGDAPSLERAIDDALAVDGPSLIDVRIDRSNYGAMMKAIRGS